MEGTAVAVCEKLRENLNRGSTILKYLIIHWRCETARISKGALLEGELVISIEALNSKHQANTLHCVTTIASAGSIFGGLVLKKFLKGVHTLLTTHLSAILTENHGVVQDSIQVTVDQALEQHHQAVKAHQKLQASLSVAVNSIMSIITGSTSSSFRKTCLQTLQAADTQEFGTKLHKSFHEITQNRFLHHCSREVKQAAEGGSSLTTGVCSSQEFGSPSEPNVSGEQVDGRKCLSMGPARRQREPGSRCASLGLRACGSVGTGPWLALRVEDPRLLLCLPGPEAEAGVQLLPEKNNAEQSTEDAHENSSLELLAETSGQVEKKSLKRGGSLCQGVEETRAFHSPRALNPSEDTLRRAEPTAAPLTPRSGLEDALWLQEISNLSEWLSPGSAS
ncbi:type 2 DNA topoisomerase 6 subunit B-like isoform X17 [Kogia breviceps]|uniref:type 2 DNA topoisomerase 6 subunit B-like isoform X17 n=1 Tax=Kogia breviceps TaxID=27615 RepID=UPI0034D19CCA